MDFKKRARPFPYLVLVLSLFFTCLATYYLAVTNRTKNMARFTNATSEVENTIRDSLNAYTALLRGGAALFAASHDVSQEEFRAYFKRLRTELFYSGLAGFGFAQRVPAEERTAFIEKMQNQGLPNFRIWPEGPRQDYFPIIYLEPLNWRNQRAVGYDMFSEPVRNLAMSRSVEQGLAISGKVTLVQETDENRQAGFLMYTAIFESGDFPATQAEREQQLIGFVYSPFRADDFFTLIFGGQRKSPISLEVFDGEETAEKHLLHRSPKIPANPRFTISNRFVIAGRTWTLIHRTTPEFEETLEYTNVIWVFFAGLGISFILFGVTFSLSKASARTERNEWELLRERELLRASEELHRTISETAADAIITINEDDKIITVNPAAKRIFGYTSDEMIGQNLTMLMPERMHQRHRDGIARYMSDGKRKIPWEGIELPGLHKDGHEIPLEISFGEIRKQGKRIFTGIVRDITERKKAEEQIRLLNRDLERRVTDRTAELQDANTQMEAFVYSIAHDLRAPLRAMRGFAQALCEDYNEKLDAQGKDYATRIIASAKFMDELINDLLTFSRITRAELNLSPTNMEAILADSCHQLAGEIRDKNAKIITRGVLPDVLAHEATIRQVLINLISNSLKFVAEGVSPHITIGAENLETHWRIFIEDNGIGIDEKYRDRIFGIFERLHGGSYPGTGIGLAIVRKGIERMNGRVGFESTLGQGTRFWFELPKAK